MEVGSVKTLYWSPLQMQGHWFQGEAASPPGPGELAASIKDSSCSFAWLPGNAASMNAESVLSPLASPNHPQPLR